MVKIRPLEKKIDWKKYKYYLLVGVILLILIGIFQSQIRQIGTFLFGVTIDKAIDLTIDNEKDFSILVLGIGGGTHDGPNLTDTIIFANVSIEEKRVDLVSIPRDLWIDSLKAKINAIYAFGKKDGKGLSNIKSATEQVVGEEINYVLIIDFKGFVNLIDHLGGVEVDVEKSFVDNEYPVNGMENDSCGYTDEQIIDLSAQVATNSVSVTEAFACRYKSLSFTEGKQIMDGETALSYVRSRHGTNGEGSDFARSRRQQKIIDALRNKVLSLEVLLNPIKAIGVFNIVKDNIVTDVDTSKLDDFVKLAQKLQDGEVRSFVVEEEDKFQEKPGLLVSPVTSERFLYQYVLVPRTDVDDFSEIHDFVDCIKRGEMCLVTDSGVSTPTPLPTDQPDK